MFTHSGDEMVRGKRARTILLEVTTRRQHSRVEDKNEWTTFWDFDSEMIREE
jgi:hypothetical protein